MKVLRWIAAVPFAMILSGIAWIVLSSILTSSGGGANWLGVILGRIPILVRSGLPTVLFVVSAVLICPSKGRPPAFVFFALALLFSGGGIETIQYGQLGILSFWVTSFLGVIVGALGGLLVSLRLQARRKGPNQFPVPISQVAHLGADHI